MKKNKLIRLRVTEEEKDRATKKARKEKLGISAWIRKIINS